MKKNYLFLLFFVIGNSHSWAQINVYDGFETPELTKIWSKDRMVTDAIHMQSNIVRKGRSAAIITLQSGDKFEKGVGKSLSSERDELMEAPYLVSSENKLYEYRFSLFLPDSFPIVSTRLVIAQWKQFCPKGICEDDSPVMAIRYVAGRLYITIQTDTITKIVFQTTNEIRNKWLDFKFKVRFSRLEDGLVDAWLNEQQIIQFKGTTAYSAKRGYPDKSYFYFKIGLYRDLMKEPMSIYIDEYSKKEVKE